MTFTEILIVENEFITGKVLQVMIEELGYAVSAVVSSNEKALQAIAEKCPDLVILDIVMNEKIEEVEAADWIRSRLGIPVIYIAEYSDTEIPSYAKPTNPYNYILKPFHNREIRASIEMALYQSKIAARLKESVERLQIVSDSSFNWEYWIGPDGECLYVSPSCERITGYRTEEFQNNPELWMNLIHADERPWESDFFHAHIFHSRGGEIEFRILTKNDQIRWIHHSCQPVFSDEGEWLGHRISNRDITERKHLEAARNQLKSRLQDALAKVNTLSRLLPICPSCRQVRNNPEYWDHVESYIREHSLEEFSQSICPECAEKFDS